LKTDELPEWSRDGKLGIDVLFDDNSFDEMQSALKQAAALAEKSENNLVQVLIGEKTPTFQEQKTTVSIPSLNTWQNEAVNRILSANELAIVHGPPGTGKQLL